MTLDFSLIEKERVGYSISLEWEDYHDTRKGGEPEDFNDELVINTLKFGDFIKNYIDGSRTYQEVFENLRSSLDEKLRQEDQNVETKKLRNYDEFTDSVLERETIMNSIRLIIQNYDVEIPNSHGMPQLW